MKKKMKQVLSAMLAAVLMISGIFMLIPMTVAAEGTTVTLGAGALTPEDNKVKKVYFGDQILWRVLYVGEHNELPVCKNGCALLISKDTLASIQFNPDCNAENANVWAGNKAQEWCSGPSGYYKKWPDGIEKDAILATTVEETNDKTNSSTPYYYKGGYEGNYYYGAAPLNKEHFFFLSAKEADTLFTNDEDRKTSGLWWWLRSPDAKSNYNAGVVNNDGWMYSNPVNYHKGARPAFNLNLSSVLFSSEISSESEKSYKLTLKDENLNISVTKGAVVTWNGSTATIPYTIGGENATNQTKAYVLVTHKAYTESDATVLQYAELGTGKSGTGKFTLDTSKASGTQGENYQIYLVAVNESGDNKKSDYAGTPCVLPYELRYDANGGTGTMKSQNVNVGDTFTFPECGFTAPAGKAFDHWKMSGVDSSSNNEVSQGVVNGIFHPNNTVKIASNCVQNGVITVSAHWKDHIHNWSYSSNGDTITAKCDGAGTCDITSGLTMTISKPSNLVYDGNVKAATLNTNYNKTAFPDIYTMRYTKDGTQIAAGQVKEPGFYRASITAGTVTANVDFTISKAGSAMTKAPKARSLTYTGSAQELVNAGTASDGTMQYALGKDAATAPMTGWSTSIPTAVSAGTYYVWYKVKGDQNHTDTDPACITVKIEEKPQESTKKEEPKQIDTPDPPAEEATPKEVQADASLRMNSGFLVSWKGSKALVKWGSAPKADTFDVYASYCGKNKCKKIATVHGTNSITITSLKGKKLDPKHSMKAYVVAYHKGVKIGRTLSGHAAGGKNSHTNAKKLKVGKKTYHLQVGKTAKIKVKTIRQNGHKKVLGDGHCAKLRYISSNPKVATVNKKGKIKAAGKGKCDIWIFAQNGRRNKVKIMVN